MGEVSGSPTVPVHPDELDHLPLLQRRNLLLGRFMSTESLFRDGKVFNSQRDQCSAGLADAKTEHSGIQTGYLGDDMDEFSDLDHISLKDRLRKLLSRNPSKSDSAFEKKVQDSSSDYGADCLLGRVNGCSPPVMDPVKVKAEPPESANFCRQDCNGLDSTSVPATIKTELDTHGESCLDAADHMNLRDRMNLPKQKRFSESDAPETETENKYFPSAFGNGYSLPKVSRQRGQPRKRRKTATDSIETALEEDAPGLLQVLVEQGISVDEM